jgi:hypothetical protein
MPNELRNDSGAFVMLAGIPASSRRKMDRLTRSALIRAPLVGWTSSSLSMAAGWVRSSPSKLRSQQ